MPNYNYNVSAQRGAALITALSILLILTILGISAMSTSALQERMAGNARDAEVAFEAAEAAMRAAETYIEGLTLATKTTNFTATGGSGGYFNPRSATNQYDAWAVNSNWTGAPTATFSMPVAQQPQYIIQLVTTNYGSGGQIEVCSYCTVPTENFTVFQITTRGYGLSSSTRVMLQSYYGKQL